MRASIDTPQRFAWLSIALLVVLGCGGPGPHDGYSTFQGCFNDVHDSGHNAQETITLCLLDHPIKGMLLDFSTVTECDAYVSTNLNPNNATPDVIDAACTAYIDMHI